MGKELCNNCEYLTNNQCVRPNDNVCPRIFITKDGKKLLDGTLMESEYKQCVCIICDETFSSIVPAMVCPKCKDAIKWLRFHQHSIHTGLDYTEN